MLYEVITVKAVELTDVRPPNVVDVPPSAIGVLPIVSELFARFAFVIPAVPLRFALLRFVIVLLPASRVLFVKVSVPASVDKVPLTGT